MSLQHLTDDAPLELRVSGGTAAKELASAICGHVGARRRVVLCCIGVPSVNVGVKAVAIANGSAATHGYLLTMLPSFDVVTIDDQERTVMRLLVCRMTPGS